MTILEAAPGGVDQVTAGVYQSGFLTDYPDYIDAIVCLNPASELHWAFRSGMAEPLANDRLRGYLWLPIKDDMYNVPSLDWLDAAAAQIMAWRGMDWKVLVHCFPPGTLVNGSTPQPIESLAVGDQVYGSDGAAHAVLDVLRRDYTGPLIELYTRGNTPVRCTPEHPLQVLRPFRWPSGKVVKPSWDKSVAAQAAAHVLDWVPAAQIQPGDFLVRPTLERVVGDGALPWDDLPQHLNAKTVLKPEPSDDLAWAFGLYIADGSTCGKFRLQWTLAITDDVERLSSVVCSFGLAPTIVKHARYTRVMVNSAMLARHFRAWFGATSYTKHIPPFLLTAAWNRAALLDGLVDGDGSRNARRESSDYFTTSAVLARQVWDLLADAGEYPYLRHFHRHAGFPNAAPAWRIEWRSANQHYTSRCGSLYCLPVTTVTWTDYSGPVYNLEVEGTQDYLANGVVAHNCAAGISRSSMVTMAYLMRKHAWGHQQALDFLRIARPIAGPNEGFLKLLASYEQHLRTAQPFTFNQAA